jgi:hypothetical protein
MRFKNILTAITIIFLLVSNANAVNFRKIVLEDMSIGSGTYTSPSGKVTGKTKINAGSFPFKTSGFTGFSPNDLVDGGFDLTVKTLDIISKGPLVDVRAFGAVGNGVTDDTTAIQAAIDSISSGNIFFPPGTYKFSVLTVPNKVNIIGSGTEATILDSVGTGTSITASAQWYHQRFQDFTLQHTNSSGTSIDMIDAKFGSSSCVFFNIQLINKSGVTQHGIIIRGENPDTLSANSSQYNNQFINVRTGRASTEVTGNALYLFGKDDTDKRCNANLILGGVFDGFSTGIWLNGNGNVVSKVTVNEASVAAIHIYGDNGNYDNNFTGSYIDSGVSGDKVRLESTHSATHHMLYINDCLRVNTPDDISLAGSNTANIQYTIKGRSMWSGGVLPTHFSSQSGQIYGSTVDSGIVHFMGGKSALGGRISASGKDYRIGGAMNNVITDNGGVSVSIFRANPGTWAGTTAYSSGTYVKPTTENDFYYEATTAGTSAAGEPAWPTTPGNTVVDSTVTWTCRGFPEARFTKTTNSVNWTKLFSINARGYIEGYEISDPPSAPANSGRIYFKDNGAGKTQLVVIFPSGAVQQIAIEP